jgi:lipopolysaccharide/colanic/teichoic acid biosynthesis glycosyltransferase
MAINSGETESGLPGLAPGQQFMKRSFDLAGALGLLLLTWPIIMVAFLVASIDTRRSGFLMQTRIGRFGRPFTMIKIRTMRETMPPTTTVTLADDPRITRLGSLLRRWKVDELPQLINILLGDMSFVGPRPDVPGFADELQGDDRIILTVRPGLTGPATLKFRNEQEFLVGHADPERYNKEVIFPEKVKLNKAYIRNYRFRDDLRYLIKTLGI